MDKKILIITPAYNEEKNVGELVRKIKRVVPNAEMLVIDDHSRDYTVNGAIEAGAIVIRHPFNMGYGVALQTGYRYALEKGYDYLAQLDSDGQHEPEDINMLLNKVISGEADLAIGSRFNEKSHFKQSGLKLMGIRVFCFLYWLLTGDKITDPTSGFQAMNRKIIRFYSTEVFPPDYPDVDMLLLLRRNRLSFIEAPVRMYPNQEFKSMHIGLKPLYYVFKMMLSLFVTLIRKKEYDERDIYFSQAESVETLQNTVQKIEPIFEIKPAT